MVHYPAIAWKYSLPVLMANCVGHCDDFLSVGQSAVFTKNGELAAQLNNRSTGKLIFDTETEAVTAQTL
jgi:predicted amidohydrolase